MYTPEAKEIMKEIRESVSQAFKESPSCQFVYFLIEPLSEKYTVRYIGRSIDPWFRFRQHISEARNFPRSSKKNIWISNLLKFGLVPELEIAYSAERRIDEVEAFAINEELGRGAPLLNEKIPAWRGH